MSSRHHLSIWYRQVIRKLKASQSVTTGNVKKCYITLKKATEDGNVMQKYAEK